MKRKVKQQKLHWSCTALTNFFDFMGKSRSGVALWDRKTGISRVARILNVSSETARRYADGKKGYEKGIPLVTIEKLIPLGFLAFVR